MLHGTLNLRPCDVLRVFRSAAQGGKEPETSLRSTLVT